MDIQDAFDEIMKYAHFRNWVPDWGVARDIYQKIPNSYSVLSPFAYSYLVSIRKAKKWGFRTLGLEISIISGLNLSG